MTNEQRGAIYRLGIHSEYAGLSNGAVVVNKIDLDTVLSLIKEQQGEIEGLKNKEVLIKRYFKKCDLIKQLTKQIDLMAKYWNAGLSMCDNCDKIVEKYKKDNCQNCIKRYFAGLAERKVEDE